MKEVNENITKFASIAHEKWRQTWIEQNNGESVPRIKPNSDGTEGDINLPFAEIHPDWQKENLVGGAVAFKAVNRFGEDIEAGSAYIHEKWMERNELGDWNAHLHVPYEELPEVEKEKDRIQFRTMTDLINESNK